MILDANHGAVISANVDELPRTVRSRLTRFVIKERDDNVQLRLPFASSCAKSRIAVIMRPARTCMQMAGDFDDPERASRMYVDSVYSLYKLEFLLSHEKVSSFECGLKQTMRSLCK